MKKFIITAFAAAFVFAGCKTEFDMVEATLGEQTITFVSDSDVETKTTMSITGNAVKYSWTEEDTNFAVFYGETAATSVTPSISGSTLSIKATFAPGTLPTEGTVDFTGYLNGSIKSFQTMDAVNNSYDPSADVMIAKASVSASDLSSPVLFQFKRMVSVAKLTLTGLPSAADKVVISADKPILGTFDNVGNYTSANGSIVVEGIGEDNVVYFTLAPNVDVTLSIIAETSSGIYEGVSNGAKTFTAGNVRSTAIAMSASSLRKLSCTEHFSSSKATSNNYDCSSSISTVANRDSFDYTWIPRGSGTVFQNGIKLGNSSGTGSVTSSDILSSIPSGSLFSVKVYAAVWNTDNGQIKVTYGSDQTMAPTNPCVTNTSEAYSSSSFANASVFYFTKDASIDSLTISSSLKRLLIDKVVVEYYSSESPDLEEKSTGEITDLTATTATQQLDAVISYKMSAGNQYSSPLRIYANSTLTISALKGYTITKVVFNCNTSAYATICDGGTITVASSASYSHSLSGNKVTYTVTGQTSSFAISASSQWRVDGITVYYLSE